MATHPSKRPYAGSQPHITSYFPSQPTSTHQYNISTPPASNDNYSYEVKLPPGVQSNLLNVGMRVRKSVPEGYKVGNNYSSFTLFSSNTSSDPTNQSSPYSTTQTQTQKQERYPKTRPRAGARELTPFCGILKVGGMKGQQWGIYSPKNYGTGEEMDEDNDYDDCPVLSQGSTASNRSIEEVHTPGEGNKKRFFEEEEEFVFGDRSVFSLGGSPERIEDRVMAVPRRRQWSGGFKTGNGQENSQVMIGREDDFHEAEFLDYGLAREVEMSG